MPVVPVATRTTDGVVGLTVSTVHAAGTLEDGPPVVTARTSNVWSPSSRPATWNGAEQTTNGCVSCRHSKVAVAFVSVKEKLASAEAESAGGDEVSEGAGGAATGVASSALRR